MNWKLVVSLLGKLLAVEIGLMAPSLAVSLAYGGGDAPALLYSMGILAAAGLPMILLSKPPSTDLHAKEGFIVVGLAWVLMSAFGALPFMFSGATRWYWDALFETVSGFTTTGASILSDVESLPRGILFWRSFTHWVGGMGVLVLTLAIMPRLSGRTAFLARAESPGPSFSKLLPRMADTSRALYVIYAVMTLALTAALLLSGLPLYDALIHAMGTAGTGGFSIRNASVGGYGNPAMEILITAFMFLFGMNFIVYFRLLKGEGLRSFRLEEVLAYLGLGAVSILAVTLSILPEYGNVFTALRYAAFQVGSIMSTTGYTTANFDLWPQFVRILLVVLMLIGACSGSTAGGMKVVRVLLAKKAAGRDIGHTLQPRKMKVITLDKKTVSEDILAEVGIFVFLYIAFLLLGTLAVSLDGHDFVSCFSAVAATLSNIGPGLSLVGPAGNYGVFSPFNKVLLSFIMLAGRLELFPMLVLFHPALWRGRQRHGAEGHAPI